MNVSQPKKKKKKRRLTQAAAADAYVAEINVKSASQVVKLVILSPSIPILIAIAMRNQVADF